MIRISQLKLPVGHPEEALRQKAARILKIQEDQIGKLSIRKRSIDARKMPVQYVYQVDVTLKAGKGGSDTAAGEHAACRKEEQLVKRLRSSQAVIAREVPYVFPEAGSEMLSCPPVIVGTGPAGLFCGLMLARAGYAPILLERGQQARERQRAVETFWSGGTLLPDSNVQFGEGGAGTFSDGKLNTLVKDPAGRGRKVLELFVEAGAPEEILYENKPHLGTDVLVGIVEHMRKEIEALGGKVLFSHQMTGICLEKGRVQGVKVRRLRQEEGKKKPEEFYLDTQVLVLAIGHSARDTFSLLRELGIPMEPKPFAVGVRVEHPQEMINRSQYGEEYGKELPAASYKLTRKVAGDRGVYSFCMCPGGYVVNASSEEGRLAVNGMSYQARDGRNANSAMIVTVRPEDFLRWGTEPEVQQYGKETGALDVLSGVEFQRRLEERAFAAGGGKIPIQLLGDFLENRISRELGEIVPCTKGAFAFGDVRGIFPEELSLALAEGISGCGRLIAGFDRPDAVLSGVESRTSSPVRILRGEDLESRIRGLYPCGEGAGYAGGITSAAMDGIHVAEKIRQRFSSTADDKKQENLHF